LRDGVSQGENRDFPLELQRKAELSAAIETGIPLVLEDANQQLKAQWV